MKLETSMRKSLKYSPTREKERKKEEWTSRRSSTFVDLSVSLTGVLLSGMYKSYYLFSKINLFQLQLYIL